jgi:outer membrane protein, heavy metal efflux system
MGGGFIFMEKRISRTLTFITIAALLGGCATFRPRPLNPTQKAAAFKARTLDSEGLKEFLRTNLGHELASWPPKIWDFQMLTLAAFYYHPDLDVVRAKWGIAEASVITAGEHPNPIASFIPEYDSTAAGGISPWILTPTLDIPIETAGKRGYRIDQAKHLSEAARLNISTVAWQVRSRLRARLVELYASRQTETFLLKQETVQQEVVKLLEQRLELGEASQPDLTQERIAVARTQLSLRDAQKQRAEARVQLADALGLSVAALDGIDLFFGFFDRTTVDLPSERVRRRALLNRPDILSALSDYAASQSALQLETARQYPDIHLGPGYSWDQGDNKWSVGVSLTLPVFNQNQGPIAEAEARRREAAARFIALQAQVIGAIDRALAGYYAALQALETADRLVDARKNQQRAVQVQFDVGQVDRLVLRSADLEVAAAELSRFNALTIVQRTIGSLEDAVHQPLNPTQAVTSTVEKNPRPSEEKYQ